MNQQQLQYFKALSNDRTQNADILDKESMKGVKNSVVEKYSDQAHFVYELLQNANDARAVNARFKLEKERLIFAHDGTRQFSISDPAKEAQDSPNGRLGDINAITSIGQSNKTESSIGKFGVGFKSVFQYTSEPCIYDPVFRFQIKRFIVPHLLESDFQDRSPNETLFVFPFDDPCKAYSDILEKLQKLIYPVLFLDKLESITITCEDFNTVYSRHVLEQKWIGSTLAQKIQLYQPTGVEQLWLFTREIEDPQHKLSCSVGYFLDDKGSLRPVSLSAFCFFPTREFTGLNFIIHAPFLLTDSREGIRAGDEHNKNMIKSLSKLAGDSMIYLRDIGANLETRLVDDNILRIIPTDEKKFPKNQSHQISFHPFYENIKTIFQTAEILPTAKGYTKKENAYWASFPTLPKLFSNSQLAEICGNSNAQWVFRNIGRDQLNHDQIILREFMTSLVRSFISDEVILKGRMNDFRGITEHFIETQPVSWLHKFYAWINESSNRIKLVKSKPVFIDSNKHAAAAYNNDNHPTLFLPVKDISGYRIINEELLNNDTTKEFIRTIGIKEPDFMAFFINVFLPKYLSNNTPCEKVCFLQLLMWWQKASNNEKTNIIKAVEEKKFLRYKVGGQLTNAAEKPGRLYKPTELLINYFENNSNIKFLALEYYKQMVGAEKYEILDAFFKELGVHYEARIVNNKISELDQRAQNLPRPQRKISWIQWEESSMEGLDFAIQNIAKYKSLKQSLAVWKNLLSYVEKGYDLNDLFSGNCLYYYYHQYSETYPSHTAELLKNETWLVDDSGVLKSPKQLTRGNLAQGYDISSDNAKRLLSFLQIPEAADCNLSDEQRAKIEFADKLNRLGFSESDIEAFIEFKRLKEAKQNPPTSTPSLPRALSAPHQESPQNIIPTQMESARRRVSTRERVVNEIVQRSERVREEQSVTKKREPRIEPPSADRDEYMPASVDFAKKIDKAKEKSAEEIEKITQLEELHTRAIYAGKYTYEWFSALLEIESFDSREDSLSSREVSISFAKAEREHGTKRTLVLKHPNRYIPHFMEELADIPIILHFGSQTKTVIMEVANIVSYSLRVKLKRDSDIEGIDFSTLTEATIDAKSPAFLLLELKKGFDALNYSPEYNMQQNLTPNIEFIFGPPGTGKTTYLARNVLMPLMAESSPCRVLVLTPTNKAADVLTTRIMESCSNKDYENWLVRFGATADEKIEQSPVYRDKSFNIRNLTRSVTITTIARFPYDSFMPQGERLHLSALNWDYIVIDEASMIPLASIVYPLYKKSPRKFIIAGDPFQIAPITSVDLWKNENIYTMVGLDSFASPKTVPHNYKVELLTTQYRSIPEIGELFSQFAYDGILKHHRGSLSRKTAGLDNIPPLNIIKFPVSRYESIYRSKRLKHSSSYQIYSALFTFEYVCHLAKKVVSNGEPFKIGIIAPYRAQADLIDKLISSENLSPQIEVYVGTIHGFQGDECDVIFAVFNTPPSISASNEMFLNKRNIINVSISRARDFLFIVMPDDETDGIENLRLVKRVEQIIKQSNNWNEQHSSKLEEEMFGESRWLEDNSFSTSHQSVNVYGLPEKRYEVRSEDAAVDIQIHRAKERPILLSSSRGKDILEHKQSRLSNVGPGLFSPLRSEQPGPSLTLRQQQTVSILKKIMQTNPSGVPLNVLAQEIQVSPSGTCVVVNALEKMGLLKRVPNPNSRRSVLIKLTPHGLEL